jgi:hypothetical protein
MRCFVEIRRSTRSPWMRISFMRPEALPRRWARPPAMRRRQLKWLWARLKQLADMKVSREDLLMKLGAARGKAPAAWRLVDIDLDRATFAYALNRDKLRRIRRREGRYLLRSNLVGRDPAQLWEFYIRLVEIEAAFKNLKDDLQLRPIFHQYEQRVEAHIFVAFLAYCLHVTLRAWLRPLAPGLTPRAILDKLAAVQMLDVHFPTTDGRTLILSRYTELSLDQKIIVQQLGLVLPPQPPPRITAAGQLAPAQPAASVDLPHADPAILRYSELRTARVGQVRIASAAIPHGGAIPQSFSKYYEGISLPLDWQAVEEARSYASSRKIRTRMSRSPSSIGSPGTSRPTRRPCLKACRRIRG